jgi:hypothetical protein
VSPVSAPGFDPSDRALQIPIVLVVNKFTKLQYAVHPAAFVLNLEVVAYLRGRSLWPPSASITLLDPKRARMSVLSADRRCAQATVASRGCYNNKTAMRTTSPQADGSVLVASVRDR